MRDAKDKSTVNIQMLSAGFGNMFQGVANTAITSFSALGRFGRYAVNVGMYRFLRQSAFFLTTPPGNQNAQDEKAPNLVNMKLDSKNNCNDNIAISRTNRFETTDSDRYIIYAIDYIKNVPESAIAQADSTS